MSLAALFLLLACNVDKGNAPTGYHPGGTADTRAPDRVIATVLLANDELTLIGMRPTRDSDLPAPQATPPLLDWTLEAASGAVIESGTIRKPLAAFAEFDETGQPAPVTTTSGSGTFEVEVPNVGGAFVLTDSAATGTSPKGVGGPSQLLAVLFPKLLGSFDFDDSGSPHPAPTPGAPVSTAEVQAGPLVQLVTPTRECVGMTLLVVAEGYTAAEEAKFEADAQRIVSDISEHPGYQEHWNDVAVYLKFFASNESGISDPAAGIQRDTAFRVEHDATVHRAILSASDVSPAVLAVLADAKAAVNADAVLYVANTAEWAGAARPWNREGFVAAHPQAGLIMSHELAHSLFDLADEYDYGTCDPEHSFRGPNVAVGLDQLPWADMLTEGVTLPTVLPGPNVVGAYEGAMYCAAGVYRPQSSCKMREAGAGFCKVCLARIDERFAARTAACDHGTCGHGECTAGDALDDQCSVCSQVVCTAKPECCSEDHGWTQDCVDLVQSTPGPCRGVCAEPNAPASCAHDECGSGPGLSADCSPCAASVCDKDPFCCSNRWDHICANEAKKDPFCSCGATP